MDFIGFYQAQYPILGIHSFACKYFVFNTAKSSVHDDPVLGAIFIASPFLPKSQTLRTALHMWK